MRIHGRVSALIVLAWVLFAPLPCAGVGIGTFIGTFTTFEVDK